MNIFLTFTSLLILYFSNTQIVDPYLKSQIQSLEKDDHLITEERKKDLKHLAEEILQQIDEQGSSAIIFVCTHNSRRSQLAQLWFLAASAYYQIDKLKSFSGGTETTAFNPRMVDAMNRFGFTVHSNDESVSNPHYTTEIGKNNPKATEMFSKKYLDPFNPQKDFIAVMVCSQADKECPFVSGAYARVSLPYEDPKEADNTQEETQVYDEKVREVGREILYLGRMILEVRSN